MRRTIILILKYLCYGVSWGCTIFVFNTLIGYFIQGETFSLLIAKDYARQALGSILVGISCGSTAVIYQFKRPAWGIKVLIHFIVGMGVFYPTSIRLGWIPFYPDKIIYTILQILLSCGIFMAIWSGFYLANRREARKINERLREMEQEEKSTSAP